jgi:hypothetical protein
MPLDSFMPPLMPPQKPAYFLFFFSLVARVARKRDIQEFWEQMDE